MYPGGTDRHGNCSSLSRLQIGRFWRLTAEVTTPSSRRVFALRESQPQMATSPKTRKLLWGRSANRCAICKRELVVEATALDQEALVGEECHIVSPRHGGPRHDASLPVAEADSYHNLILLCRVHHTMVDEQSRTYNADAVRGIKAAHETWVSESLRGATQVRQPRLRWRRKSIPEYLIRLTTGRELLNLLLGAHFFSFDHDELRSEQEVDVVGAFLQAAYEYGDVGEDLEPYQRVRDSVELTRSLEELERAGFFVFGGREVRVLEGSVGGPEDFVIAILRVLRETSDAIVKVRFVDEAGNSGTRGEHGCN